MRHIILFAVAVLLLGGYAARFADTVSKDPQVVEAYVGTGHG